MRLKTTVHLFMATNCQKTDRIFTKIFINNSDVVGYAKGILAFHSFRQSMISEPCIFRIILKKSNSLVNKRQNPNVFVDQLV